MTQHRRTTNCMQHQEMLKIPGDAFVWFKEEEPGSCDRVCARLLSGRGTPRSLCMFGPLGDPRGIVRFPVNQKAQWFKHVCLRLVGHWPRLSQFAMKREPLPRRFGRPKRWKRRLARTITCMIVSPINLARGFASWSGHLMIWCSRSR